MWGGQAVLHAATGFTGALTLVFVLRILSRWLLQPPRVEAYFSPGGGCTEAVVREIQKARRQILVQAYAFNSRAIAEALVKAKTRGLDVVVLLDPINEEAESELPYVLEQGLAPLIEPRTAYAHNHLVVVDRKTILTGSFPLSTQAEEANAANLLVLHGHADLARRYADQFAVHKSEAQPPKKRQEMAR